MPEPVSIPILAHNGDFTAWEQCVMGALTFRCLEHVLRPSDSPENYPNVSLFRSVHRKFTTSYRISPDFIEELDSLESLAAQPVKEETKPVDLERIQKLRSFMREEQNFYEEEWIEADRKARGLLMSHVDSVLYAKGASAKTTQEWIDIIGSHFYSPNLATKMGKMREFYTAKMGSAESIVEYHQRVLQLGRVLSRYGIKIDEDHLMAAFVFGLRPEFEQTYGYMGANKTYTTLAEMLPAFLERESRFKEESQVALVAQQSSPFPARTHSSSASAPATSSAVRKEVCHHCKRPGHPASRCYSKYPHLRPTKPRAHFAHVPSSTGESALSQHSEIAMLVADLGTKGAVGLGDLQLPTLLDSGASSSFMADKSAFADLRLEARPPVIVGGGNRVAVKGIGTVSLPTVTGEPLVIQEVLYAPDLGVNLLSVGKLMRMGVSTHFIADSDGNPGSVYMERDGATILRAVRKEELFRYLVANAEDNAETHRLWHRRFGHMPTERIMRGIPDWAKEHGLLGEPIRCVDCTTCIKANMVRGSFGSSTGRARATEPGEYFHMDLGTVPEPSVDGHKHYMVVVDDATRMIFTVPLKSKSQAALHFRRILTLSKTQTGVTAKAIKSDRGGEFTGSDFQAVVKDFGLVHHMPPPSSPEGNGVAERANRTLGERLRVMLLDASMPRAYWHYALATATYIANRSPTSSIDMQIPVELWGGDVSHGDMRVWGCRAFVHVPAERRDKLMPRSQEGTFVGYSGKHYHVLVGNKLIESADVEFREDERGPHSKEFLVRIQLPAPTSGSALVAEEAPAHYKDALESVLADHWRAAMNEEMAAHDAIGTWTAGIPPDDVIPVDVRWVYALKKDAEGNLDRRKARVVAKGYTQVKGRDFIDSSAPVVHATSLRLLLAFAHDSDWHVVQADVKTAFLNGKLEEDVWINPPPGYEPADRSIKYKLNRALYGLKQAGHQWHKTLAATLGSLGLEPLRSEPCIFSLRTDQGVVFVAAYVDDLIICGDLCMVDFVIAGLQAAFTLTIIGTPKNLLGMLVEFDGDVMTLSQPAYIKDILERHRLADCNPCKTPLVPHSHPSIFAKEGEPYTGGDYSQVLGELQWLASRTRPDLAASVSMLASHQVAPTAPCMSAAKHMLRYLKGTAHYKLRHTRGSGDGKLSCYVDADYAGDVSDRKSRTGYVVMLGDFPVAWGSHKQICVSKSTAEAEYVALSEAASEVLWLRHLMEELGKKLDEPTPMHEDNRACIDIVTGSGSPGRTEHIDLRYHFSRDYVKRGELTMVPTSTLDQTADILTKSLAHDLHLQCVRRMGLTSDKGSVDTNA
jgi:hypothetical protein